jgi:glycerophosphoryl diester phosphodiesterase
VVGVWAVLRRPDYFASIDLALEPRVAQAIRSNGYNWRSAAMVVSAPDGAALKSLAALTRVRLVQRLNPEGDAREGPPQALQDIHTYAAGVERDVTPQQDMRSLAEEIHGAGLGLYARAIDVSRPIRDRRGFWRALFDTGVDGVICDTPGEAVSARNASAERSRRRD